MRAFTAMTVTKAFSSNSMVYRLLVTSLVERTDDSASSAFFAAARRRRSNTTIGSLVEISPALLAVPGPGKQFSFRRSGRTGCISVSGCNMTNGAR